MDSNELLFDVYQNAEFARDIIGRLIKHCESSDFRKLLAEQYAEYHTITEDAKAALWGQGVVPRTIGRKRRKAIYAATEINLKIDKTPSHMAEMLMQGSLLGMIDISKSLTQNRDADEYSKHLANKLVETEANNIRSMREFL
ncbi:MAG: hypothetical protein IJO48_07085 [Clostridia bacterium]|nr:hypothetical protein [Clostridia bacterium]